MVRDDDMTTDTRQSDSKSAEAPTRCPRLLRLLNPRGNRSERVQSGLQPRRPDRSRH